jgi:hypothetical protein
LLTSVQESVVADLTATKAIVFGNSQIKRTRIFYRNVSWLVKDLTRQFRVTMGSHREGV